LKLGYVNSGETPWTTYNLQVKNIYQSCSNIWSLKVITNKHNIAPGEEYKFEVKVAALYRPETYFLSFQLCFGNDNLFGEEIYCIINIIAPRVLTFSKE